MVAPERNNAVEWVAGHRSGSVKTCAETSEDWPLQQTAGNCPELWYSC